VGSTRSLAKLLLQRFFMIYFKNAESDDHSPLLTISARVIPKLNAWEFFTTNFI